MATQPPTSTPLRQCFHCGVTNPTQAFCGACGSPLVLHEYISARVKSQLADTIRNRDVLEMDSSIKVFKQAWGWIKLIGGIAVGLLVITGAGVIWKASDFWSGVNKAQQTVVDTAKKSANDITHTSSQSQQDIATAVEAAKGDIVAASTDAIQQSRSLKTTALKSKTEISKDTASFHDDLEGSRQQLQAASKLQPEMESMRKQLAQANSDIQAQQKIISSSQNFVKSVFSSHLIDMFAVNQQPAGGNYCLTTAPPSPNGIGATTVYLLLRQTPIQGTLQLQYHIYAQPPYSYFVVAHNLIVFSWGDPPSSLQGKAISVSYFPDIEDKELIKKLSLRDERCFADDDQPLFKLNQLDPDFKGNKWWPVTTIPAKP